MEPLGGFADLGLRPELLSAVSDLGYEEPTPIQRDAIPHLLAGRDVLGQAATGTGKTAAFALPALQLITDEDRRRPAPIALVLVPTRELAVQVSEAMYRYGRELGAKVVPIYGGQPIGRQLGALRDGVHVVVATPGRAIDHIHRGTLRARRASSSSCSTRPTRCSTWASPRTSSRSSRRRRPSARPCCSRPRCRRASTRIAQRHLRDPVRIEIERAATDTDDAPAGRRSGPTSCSGPTSRPPSGASSTSRRRRAALVFCRTRTEVDELTETLNGRGYRAEALHGGMNQEGRDRVMGRLRNGHGRAADRHRRGGPRPRRRHADPRHQLRRAVGPRRLHPPHRPCRPGRSRGRRHHAGRAPRAAACWATSSVSHGRPIPIEQVPSVADLRARQLALTTTASARCAEPTPDDRDRFATVVDASRRRVRRAGRRAGGDQAGPRRVRRRARSTIPESSPRTTARARATAPGPRQASGKFRRRRQGARRGCSSVSGATTASGPATSSARSPTSPTSPAATSARSTSPTGSRPSMCRRQPPTRCIAAIKQTTIKGKRDRRSGRDRYQ